MTAPNSSFFSSGKIRLTESVLMAKVDSLYLHGRYLITDPCYIYGADSDEFGEDEATEADKETRDQWSEIVDAVYRDELALSFIARRERAAAEVMRDIRAKKAIRFDADPYSYEGEEQGDLFAFQDERALAHMLDPYRRNRIMAFVLDNILVPIMKTAHGDGWFPVFSPVADGKDKPTRVGTIGVDSGLFCLLPENAAPKITQSIVDDNLGAVIDLSGKLVYSGGNAWMNANILVDTSGTTD